MGVNYIALAVPVFFLLIGIELLVAWRQKRKLYRLNDAITDLSCGIGQQVTGVFFMGVLVAAYTFIFAHWAFFSFADGSLVPWIIAFFGVDFAYYWWHRLSHEIAFMWAIHVVHHQSEDYNLAVALRQAWFSSLSSSVFYLPLALVGVPPLVFFTIAAFSTLYQFWIHTRVIGKLGPIEWVFNTASQHRVHHGRNPKYLDRNYAATLCIWDRLFGSFQEEEEEPLYGTIAPYSSWNPVWANFDFWAYLGRKARSTPRLLDKVRVFVKSPGWSPPGFQAHEEADAASDPPVRYETSVPLGLNLYIVAQFVVVLGAAMKVYDLARTGDRLVVAAIILLILLSTLTLGGLFERRTWALGLEFVRLGLLAATVAALFFTGFVIAPVAIVILVTLASFAVWLAQYRAVVVIGSREPVNAPA
jgi:alkylglycerol monooxygenase